ncbi:MAG: hypothetical protein JXA42_03530 [Anaerolineales bacterium]|nr:hypothetical protein [Anaerolineales bacterium]
MINKTLTLLILLFLSITPVVFAQGGNGITSPRDNAVVAGDVLIEGTATDPNFLRYELAFFKEFDPFGDWVVFATGQEPVVNGVLTIWDTKVGRDTGSPFYPDGTYRLRLRVVRQDSNYDEYFILGISLVNDTATPTATETPGQEISPSTTPTFAVVVPTELATLTPFPSTTPHPTSVSGETAPIDDSGSNGDDSNSILKLEGEFDSSKVKAGFFTGIKLAIVFFVLVGFYVFLRKILTLFSSNIRSWDIWRHLRGWFSR